MAGEERAALPIGVFDSGIGGLTVAREMLALMPRESLVYLGDTARVPYGTKSPQTVIRYSEGNTGFLLTKGIKALVVACNTASAMALPALKGRCDVPVVGVIEPGARRAAEVSRAGRVGVIGTPSTIASGAYTREVRRIDPNIEVYAAACPLFVQLADEGLNESDIALLAARRYLAPLREKGVDVLILGCTHYPLLKGVIGEVMGKGVSLVDSAEETAREVKSLLIARSLENRSHEAPRRQFYLTDVSPTFVEVAERFLGQGIERIEVVDI